MLAASPLSRCLAKFTMAFHFLKRRQPSLVHSLHSSVHFTVILNSSAFKFVHLAVQYTELRADSLNKRQDEHWQGWWTDHFRKWFSTVHSKEIVHMNKTLLTYYFCIVCLLIHPYSVTVWHTVSSWVEKFAHALQFQAFIDPGALPIQTFYNKSMWGTENFVPSRDESLIPWYVKHISEVIQAQSCADGWQVRNITGLHSRRHTLWVDIS